MSTENAGSAASQESSGSPEQTNQDKVAYETYKRVLSEAKRVKDELKAMKEAEAKAHETKLREQNEWKALAESKAKQAEELQRLYKEQQEQIVNGMKYQEFEKHLGGRLKDRDYATFIDFDRIIVNPETREIDIDSVKSVAAEFVKKHSSLVEFQTGGKMPNEAPRSFNVGYKSPSDMTKDELTQYILEQHRKGFIK